MNICIIAPVLFLDKPVVITWRILNIETAAPCGKRRLQHRMQSFYFPNPCSPEQNTQEA